MLPKTFTVAQANALVPWLARQFSATRKLAKELKALRQDQAESEKMRTVEIGGRVMTVDPDPDLLRRISSIEGEIRGHLEDALSLGVEIRRVDGLVDFPSWREGQPVYLCWKLGEREVSFWHTAGQGVEHRRPLFARTPEVPAVEVN